MVVNRIKFGNIAVKYQPDMYMLETKSDDLGKFPEYNEYKKGQLLRFKVKVPDKVYFHGYDPNERRIYLKHDEEIYYCSEEEFHEWVGCKEAQYIIGIPDPVMIDTKTGMPYTNISTDEAFLYEFEGYEQDCFEFVCVDYSKECEVNIIMRTKSSPSDCKILKFIKNNNESYSISNPPTLIRNYHKR